MPSAHSVRILCLWVSASAFSCIGAVAVKFNFFSADRKSLKKGVLLYVHANLAVALFLGLLVFALGVQSAVSVNVSCML